MQNCNRKLDGGEKLVGEASKRKLAESLFLK